ncbi:hypothetical protein L6V77_12005 [Myxococcota bacterium]|nr:hypothetical protein [Myxococcota bacterium]
MRSDAGSRNPTAAGLLAAVLLGACSGGGSDAPRAPEEKISRTDSVKISPKAQAATNAAPPGASFCEKLYKPGEKPFKAPAERPISGVKPPPPRTAGWTYVNLWATWCKPCVEEMGLFGRWGEALAKDGLPVNMELWSIDAASDEDALRARVQNGLPGAARWVASEADFASFVEGVGLDKTAAIPIHILVDPAQNVRCVRVGSIHPEDYAQVKGIVSQP